MVYFPSGNYLVASTIDLPDSVILRGISSDSAHIIFNLNNTVGNGFNSTGSTSGIFTLVISGTERGSEAIVVSDPSTFSAGDYAELIENNGSWDTQPVFWADNSVGQILHLIQISGDTLFFDSPLRINYDTSLSARIQKIIPAVETGIECLTISRSDTISSGVCFNIYFNYAANCWLRGVESNKSIGSHVEVDASTNISIRGCYFHHSYLYDGVSTHGYGITLFSHTGQCLIENNIMQHLRHSFSLQTGANGNVIAYNYSFDPFRSEFPSDFGADISLHGHFPFSNLFEGNIVQNIQIDQTHGPNGPFNTFFRNRAEKYGIIMTSGSYQSDSMNFVGNEIPNTSFPFGNYTLVGSAHFEYGNNIKGVIQPTGTSPLPDSSYYLSDLPAFWTTTIFPIIGIPNVLASGTIPAYDRYLSGSHFTDCDDDITIGIEALEYSSMEVFPNPNSGIVTIRLPSGLKGCLALLKDLSGKIIFQKTFYASHSEYVMEFPKEIKTGIYLLEVLINKNTVVKKIVIVK